MRKAGRIAAAMAIVLVLVTWDVHAQLYKVKLVLTRYSTDGVTLSTVQFVNKDIVGACTNDPSKAHAQLVVVENSSTNVPSAILTVDGCGNVLCTNYLITTLCQQAAATGSSSGKLQLDSAATHVEIDSPDGLVTGRGLIAQRAKGNATNHSDVVSYLANGIFVLCGPSGNVAKATLTVGGVFKPTANCP